MAEDTTVNPQAQMSEVVFNWQHPDYVLYHKDVRWYVFSVIILVIGVVWAFWQANYLFGIFLIMFYLVVLLYENRAPEMIDFYITPLGIRTGKKFHPWREIDHFYVVYRAQGIKNLYIEFKNPLNGRLVVPLDGQNAVAIRSYLLKFLTEDLEREAEPISEQLRRWLKI